MGIVIHDIIIIKVWRVDLTFPKLPNHTPLYKNPITVTPLLMTSLSSQSLIPTLQIQRIQHLQASLHLFLYYCKINAPHLTPPPPPPNRSLLVRADKFVKNVRRFEAAAWGRGALRDSCPSGCELWLSRKIYSYFEKGCRKKRHPTIPKGNVGYDQYTVPDTVAVDGTYFSCFPNLALANSYFHGLSCHSFKFL